MSEKIDWSDLEQVEPVPGGEWDGRKIIARYQSVIDDGFPHLVVVQDADGACEAETVTDDGRKWDDCPPLIRNKPKRVTLQECWIVYHPDGVQATSTSCSDTAADYAKDGFIVRHIPAEEREV